MATVPSLYPVLVELNVVPSILGLLNHDNTDISVGVVDLLQVCQDLRLRLEMGLLSMKSSLPQELTDVDTLTESEDGANALIEALVERQVLAILLPFPLTKNVFDFFPKVCSLLVNNLDRMDESVKEEAEGVHNTLYVFYMRKGTIWF